MRAAKMVSMEKAPRTKEQRLRECAASRKAACWVVGSVAGPHKDDDGKPLSSTPA